MQLVAMGAQDVYLTGNPQITFFKVVYRRHTNFSKECISQTFSGSINASSESSVTCTLSRNGDLVQEIYLVTNHTVTADAGAGTASADIGAEAPIITAAAHGLVSGDKIIVTQKGGLLLTDEAGTAVTVNDGDVYVVRDVVKSTNAFKLQKLDGTLLVTAASTLVTNAGTNFTFKTDNKDTLDEDMTNLIKEVEVEIGGQKIDKHYSQWLDIYNELFETSHDYRMMMSTGSQVDAATNKFTCYLPLRFWFNRNPGLALPLIALQYHEVKINVTLNPDGPGTDATLNDAKLLVNYLYLDTDERRRFAQVSHEYLIEQVQHTGVETEPAIDMNFNHPVKALFWTQPGATLGVAKLQLNGHDRAEEQAHDYYHLVQPYESGLGHCGKSLNTSTRKWGDVVKTGVNNNVGMYSFCLKPAEHQPSGTCNFSRIDNARLNLAGASNLYLFALNYNVLRIMSGMGGLAYSN